MHHLAGHIEADPQIGARQPQVEEGRGTGLEGREADEVAHHDLGLQTVHDGNLAARQHQVMLVHPRIEQEVIDRHMSRQAPGRRLCRRRPAALSCAGELCRYRSILRRQQVTDGIWRHLAEPLGIGLRGQLGVESPHHIG